MAAVLKTGARFTLRRQAVSEDTVVYEAVIELPGDVFHEQVLTFSSADGAFTTTGATDAPSWTVTWLESLAKRLGRGAVKSGVWPRKQRQWKDAPAL